MVTKTIITGSTIGIRRMIGMIIEVIQVGIRIMIGMITCETIVIIRVVMKINNMIIEEMIAIIGINISHHLGIMVVHNIKGSLSE